MYKSLTELANIYATDKGTKGPSEHWHANNYTDIYSAYLERYRQSPINILEIGLGVTGNRWDAFIVHGRNRGGASLRMWYDYFPKARIFGIDVNECAYLDNDRIKTFVADQGNLNDLDRFAEATRGANFDIVVDDGSHRPDHQQIAFGYMFKEKLKDGGLYFIEDLLANGLGDGARGRMVSDEVRNTRRVLRAFTTERAFLTPHALLNTRYLMDSIDFINFHNPSVTQGIGFRPDPRHPLRRKTRYRAGTERLCVISKR